MALECSYDISLLVALHLYNTDVRIRATNSDIPGILVNGDGESNGVSTIDLHNLLYHSDVPSFENTIRIARSDVVASDGELSILDRI